MKFEVDLMPGTVSWLETQPPGTIQAALTEYRHKGKCYGFDLCCTAGSEMCNPGCVMYVQERENL